MYPYPSSISPASAGPVLPQQRKTENTAPKGHDGKHTVKDQTATKKSDFQKATEAALKKEDKRAEKAHKKAERRIAKDGKQLKKTKEKFDKEVQKEEIQNKKKFAKMAEKAAKAERDQASGETYKHFKTNLSKVKATIGEISSNEMQHLTQSSAKAASKNKAKTESSGLYKEFKGALKSIPEAAWKRLPAGVQKAINEQLEDQNKKLNAIKAISKNNHQSGIERLREFKKLGALNFLPLAKSALPRKMPVSKAEEAVKRARE